MNSTSDETTNPKFRMWLRPDGIAQQVWEPQVAIGLDDAIASIDAMTALTGGRRCPLMVDVHTGGAMDRPARMHFARSGHTASAIALVVRTPLSRMMGNIYLTASKPLAPTRLFDDETTAIAWLSDFR